MNLIEQLFVHDGGHCIGYGYFPEAVFAYVLAEEKNNQEAGFITGRTEQNYIVHFKGNEELIGKIVPVKLCESKGFYYYGEM